MCEDSNDRDVSAGNPHVQVLRVPSVAVHDIQVLEFDLSEGVARSQPPRAALAAQPIALRHTLANQACCSNGTPLGR